MMRGRERALGWMRGAVIAVALSGCAAVGSPDRTVAVTSRPGASSTADARTAQAVLGTLPVKGRAPKIGYARREFGEAWTDANTALWGGNGLSTREDVLSRDLTSITCKLPPPRAAAPRCVVNSGVLHDPYTGKTIHFTRGVTTSQAVQIDHMVALGDAWQKGAQQLSRAQRIELANDPLNLVAVDGPTNEAKGDGDAATWLPPNKRFRCAYVARQIAVKVKYRLWVTAAEKSAMTRVLSACPNQPVPTVVDAEHRTY